MPNSCAGAQLFTRATYPFTLIRPVCEMRISENYHTKAIFWKLPGCAVIMMRDWCSPAAHCHVQLQGLEKKKDRPRPLCSRNTFHRPVTFWDALSMSWLLPHCNVPAGRDCGFSQAPIALAHTLTIQEMFLSWTTLMSLPPRFKNLEKYIQDFKNFEH